MLEGIYFQFPKLGFVLFFFLACEALCPLRSNPLYYPHTPRFGDVGVKPKLWIWVAKWAMIILLIIALMSPVRDKELRYEGEGRYDILLVLDPASLTPALLTDVRRFIDKRSTDPIALWVPSASEIKIPLTEDHAALQRILDDVVPEERGKNPDRSIGRFFNPSAGRETWAVVFSDRPETVLPALPKGVELSLSPPGDIRGWIETLHTHHPGIKPVAGRRYVDYYYFFPLFGGFMAMLLYLYGRNQKGLR